MPAEPHEVPVQTDTNDVTSSAVTYSISGLIIFNPYYNACKGIKTEQVLDAVNMSRSNLEQRFKKEVGKTIHAVIYEEKLKRAKNLLATTTLSIQEISLMCGYPSLQYFYSIFKKEFGMTPKDFRDEN